MRTSTFHELQALPVLDAAGERIGKVLDVEFDSADWTVKSIIVRLERAAADKLGMHRMLGSVELALKIIHVHAIGDAVVLRDTVEDLARVAPAAADDAAHAAH